MNFESTPVSEECGPEAICDPDCSAETDQYIETVVLMFSRESKAEGSDKVKLRKIWYDQRLITVKEGGALFCAVVSRKGDSPDITGQVKGLVGLHD